MADDNLHEELKYQITVLRAAVSTERRQRRIEREVLDRRIGSLVADIAQLWESLGTLQSRVTAIEGNTRLRHPWKNDPVSR